MKRLQNDPGGAGRFDQASRWVEDRFGHWPTWAKIVTGIPILIVLTGLVVLCLDVVGTGVVALIAGGHH